MSVRVERRDQVGHTDAEPRPDVGEPLDGERVALLGGLGHLGPVSWARSPPQSLGQVVRHRRARTSARASRSRALPAAVLLPAAAVAALAAAARPARPACARTRRPCRWRRGSTRPSRTTAPPMPVPSVMHRTTRRPRAGAEPAISAARGAVGVVVEHDRDVLQRSASRARTGSSRHGRCGANMHALARSASTKPAARDARPPSTRRAAVADQLVDGASVERVLERRAGVDSHGPASTPAGGAHRCRAGRRRSTAAEHLACRRCRRRRSDAVTSPQRRARSAAPISPARLPSAGLADLEHRAGARGRSAGLRTPPGPGRAAGRRPR